MNRDDILQLAASDALGLLSPSERTELELAFLAADPATRAEIRRVQDTVAGMIDALPPEEAPASLRARVMDRIQHLIEEDLAESIHESVIARVGGDIDRRDWVERFMAGRVSPMWRVACLVLVTASLCVGWYSLEAHRTNRVLSEYMVNNATREFLRESGALADDFLFDPDATFATLQATRPEQLGRAVVAYIASQNKGFLYADGIPESDFRYRLCVGTDQGELETIKTFSSDGETVGVAFDLSADEAEGKQIWIVGSVENTDDYILVTGL